MSQKLETRAKSDNQVSCDASNKQKSEQFLKQMIALPVSNIVFLRGIFGEQEFKDRYIGSMKVKMLRKDSKKDDNVGLLIEWMKGCFHALEQNYLKSVTLTIHDVAEPRENPIESYTFSVSYKGDEMTLQRNGEDVSNTTFSEKNVKKAAVNCLQNLCEMVDGLDVLPDEVVMNMELAYYDDRTPKDYEPPGFRPAEARIDHESMEVGEVETKFHRLQVKVFTRQLADISLISTQKAESAALPCQDDSSVAANHSSTMKMETSPVAAAAPAVARSAAPAAGVSRTAAPAAAAPPTTTTTTGGNNSRTFSPLPRLHRTAPEASAEQAVPGSLNSTKDYSVVGDSMAAEESGRGGGGGGGGGGKAKATESKKGARKPTKRKGASPPSEKNSESVKSVKRPRK